jgi:O-acetylserine/cysteine efflux transporter
MTPSHLLLLVFANACWGFNFIAGKLGTELFGPILFSAIRFVMVLALLAPFLRVVPGQMIRILLIGLMLGVIHYPLMFFAMYATENLSAVAIAAQLMVPFSTILAILFLHERIGWTRTVAITLSFTGVVIIGFEPIGADHVLALSLVTGASFAIALTSIWMRQLKDVGVFNLQAWIALIASVSLTVLALIFESPSIEMLQSIPWLDYWMPLYSAVGATIIGHGSFYLLLQRYPVNQVAPFVTLSTLFAIVFGVLLLGDQITGRILLGGVLTLVGVTVIARRNAATETPSSIRVPR